MSNVKSQATEKIRAGLKEYKGNRYGDIMKQWVADTLISFCEQNMEFAQAVIDGGEFKDCMGAIVSSIKGNAMEEKVAAKTAAQFFFPGCEIQMTMTIYTSAFEMQEAEAGGEEAVTEGGGIVLNLEDFL